MRFAAILVALVLSGTGCRFHPAIDPGERFSGAQLGEARSLLDAGELHAGLTLLETWIAANPDAPAAQRADFHALATHACALLRRPVEGLAHAEAALVLEPDDPWLNYARGVALHTTGDHDAALQAFSRALASDACYVKAAQWRGYTLFVMGRPAEALRDYDTALASIRGSTDAALRSSAGSREDLMAATLRGRADVLDALGRHAAAEADRAAAR